MAGTNNFLQWNPGSVNQESDTAYNTDSLRTGGAPSGTIFPSPTANKLFFQVTTMVAALAQTMANKGYNISDANLSNLITALSNLIAVSDYSMNLTANNGYIKFTKLGNLMLQWGTGSASGGSTTYYHATYSPAFTNVPYIVLPVGIPPTRSVVYVANASEGAPADPSNAGVYLGTAGSVCAVNWFAIGV